MAEIVAPPSGPLRASCAPSYIEWAPVIAGAVLAAALSFVLLTFGRELAFLFFRRTRPIPTATPQLRWRLSGGLWFR